VARLSPQTGVDGPAPGHLACRSITKAFGGTVALRGVSVEIREGSVHALIGENGAGKSTLGKIIAGAIQADDGELVLRGETVVLHAPRDALAAGIAIVAQELALVPALTVAENVFLGIEPRRAGFILRRELRRRFERLSSEADFDLPADAPVGSLSIARQQQVEILRALARDAELIVMDEPTASLAAPDAERLREIVRRLAAAGRTIVLVSHVLREVLDLADTVTVLRDGAVIRTSPTVGENEGGLIAAMLGRPAGHAFPARRPPPADASAVLRVIDLHATGLHGVSMEVRAGEIVGLAGLVGAGRSELVRAIFGAAPVESGRVELGGRTHVGGIAAAIRSGMAFIPESRKDDGLLLGRPVRENVSLASLGARSRFGIVARARERSDVRGALDRSTVRADTEQPALTLSGGNQQKLMFARALLVSPRVLLADEPTRGVDVGAKRAIYELLVQLAADGVGVLLVSSELEEILGLAHRVLVMRGGQIVRELAGDEISESVVLAAAFASAEEAA
jgi:ABC-type sugar transport system ATPase subunit